MDMKVFKLIVAFIVMSNVLFAQEADLDGDGVFDKEDECPADAGAKENKGCPIKNSDTLKTKEEVLAKSNSYYLKEVSVSSSFIMEAFDLRREIEGAATVADKKKALLLYRKATLKNLSERQKIIKDWESLIKITTLLTQEEVDKIYEKIIKQKISILEKELELEKKYPEDLFQ
jgi:hypothetical protein